MPRARHKQIRRPHREQSVYPRINSGKLWTNCRILIALVAQFEAIWLFQDRSFRNRRFPRNREYWVASRAGKGISVGIISLLSAVINSDDSLTEEKTRNIIAKIKIHRCDSDSSFAHDLSQFGYFPLDNRSFRRRAIGSIYKLICCTFYGCCFVCCAAASLSCFLAQSERSNWFLTAPIINQNLTWKSLRINCQPTNWLFSITVNFFLCISLRRLLFDN